MRAGRPPYVNERWQTALGFALILAFPVLAHVGAVTGDALVTAAAMVLLVSLLLAPGLLRRRASAWLAWIGLTAGLLAMSGSHAAALPLLLVPVALDAFVAWLFGHTLARGREPLIACIIRVLDGADVLADPAVATYARRLTWYWTGLMSVLAIVAGLLALCVRPDGLLAALGVDAPLPISRSLWSWYANGVNYAAVAIMFILEFAWRRHVLPQIPQRSLREFATRLVALWPQIRALPTRETASRPRA